MKQLFLVFIAIILAGCMPSHGPSTIDMALSVPPKKDGTTDYVSLKLNPQVVDTVEAYITPVFLNEFGSADHAITPIALGVDDQLIVNIWEASPDGLFSTIEQKNVQILTEVDENGDIFIPYAGRVRALDKTVEEVRKVIEDGLKGKAVEPQVQVLLKVNNSNNITVVGDVTKPGQYPVPTRGIRLMEVIAQAGGTKQATFETEATIVRNITNGKLWLDETIKNPKKNIWLASKDVVQILHRPRSFSAFGAVGSQHLVPFKTETVTLAEALAQVGGLNDRLADSGGVFLFRFEEPTLVSSLTHEKANTVKGKVPTIYRLDLSRPKSFFLASSFSMKDKDIIYVSNAPAAEYNKFLTTIVGPTLAATKAGRDTFK